MALPPDVSSPQASALEPRIVVLGTGGTIAGTAAQAGDNVGYTAAQVTVQGLLAGVARGGSRLPLPGVESEQVAQVDSKDMSHAVWRRLAERVSHHLARAEVLGIVITHGTDTLEETAYLLHRVLGPDKPVVLTAAMRPADSRQADGPQNLLDALALVAAGPAAGLRGVLVALGGRVWAGQEARKVHPYRLDAFDAGDAGALASIEEGRLRVFRPWPPQMVWPTSAAPLGLGVLAADIWPEVQIVTSHAGADGRLVELLLESGVQGIVVACPGNGSVHHEMLSALLRAQHEGVLVLRALRNGSGAIVPGGHVELPDAGALTAAQARVELLLRLLSRRG